MDKWGKTKGGQAYKKRNNKKITGLKKPLTDKFGRLDNSKITKTTWKSKDGKTTYVKFDYFGKGDPKYDPRARKGYKHNDSTRALFTRIVKRKLRNDISFTNTEIRIDDSKPLGYEHNALESSRRTRKFRKGNFENMLIVTAEGVINASKLGSSQQHNQRGRFMIGSIDEDGNISVDKYVTKEKLAEIKKEAEEFKKEKENSLEKLGITKEQDDDNQRKMITVRNDVTFASTQVRKTKLEKLQELRNKQELEKNIDAVDRAILEHDAILKKEGLIVMKNNTTLRDVMDNAEFTSDISDFTQGEFRKHESELDKLKRDGTITQKQYSSSIKALEKFVV